MHCKFAAQVFATVCVALAAAHAGGDTIIEWNRVASDVLLVDSNYQNPGMASRSMAMMNLAIYDAVNGVLPRHRQMFTHGAAPQVASPEAAAIQAAYRVLYSIYPDQQSLLDSERATSLNLIENSPAKAEGIAYGDLVASQIVAARATDGFDNMVLYTPQGDPGRWEPDPLNASQTAWGPQWGDMQTFALESTSQLIVPAVPALSSQQYTDAFDEVKSLGALDSSTRTPEQTEIGLFWSYDRLGMGTPMRMYNAILRTVADQQGNSLSDNARLFAMATTSVADAGIVAWDTKFTNDFWRPVSGIRRADEDGNPYTVADPDWVPLGAPGGIAPDGTLIDPFTPPFPTYLSGHASFGGALFQSLENFYGTDDISFEVTSDELPGVVRSYTSFSQASEENGRSRVYLGIHWNFDDIQARAMGANLANYVSDHRFLAIPEPSSLCLAVLGVCCLVVRLRWRSIRSSAAPGKMHNPIRPRP